MSNTRKLKHPRRSLPPRMAEPSIVEQVSEADRAYFEQHPGAVSYVRSFVPGEFGQERPLPGAVVIVEQIAPGVRRRRAVVPPVNEYRRIEPWHP